MLNDDDDGDKTLDNEYPGEIIDDDEDLGEILDKEPSDDVLEDFNNTINAPRNL